LPIKTVIAMGESLGIKFPGLSGLGGRRSGEFEGILNE